MKKQKGFTLIEILVTATIMAVLTAIGIVSFRNANIKARDGKRKADVQQVRSALEMYRSDNPTYPAESTWTGLMSELTSPVNYLTGETIIDPKNVDPYVYTYTSDGSIYSICADMESDGPGSPECFTNP